MALPRKLKHLNLFNDGNNWQGIVESLTLPKFTRKYEKYRGGGMPGAVDVDLGLDDSALDTEFSIGGTELLLFKQMGKATVDGIQLRFTGSITTVLDNRLMSLTLTDNRGFEADQLDLELDDADGKIVLPRRGAVITLALGWKGQSLFPKGAFTVDEIEHTGAPDRLTIRARSADFRETLNIRREKSWHKTTVGEVVKEIAVRHKLKMALGEDLSDKPVEHIDQTNESDGSFLMRLARQYGAIASVKNGNLLFIRQGQGKSASGKPLPVITITRKDGDSHRFTLADRGAYTGVIASWLHTREPAKKESTTVKRKRRTKKQKKEPEAKQGDYLVGTDENVLVLNRTYANRSNAERAAKMQWERLQRGVASFSLQLAEGRADLYTEMPVKVRGFKQPIDDAEWTITTLTHTVNPDNGFTTSLELEVKINDFEME
ncbi:phage major tail tube protein [Escherichia coli]|nr:phage major tail tube protein [Escherichia coli]